MERQVDEVDTYEIEIEDMEVQKHYSTTVEGQIDRAQINQDFQMAKSP